MTSSIPGSGMRLQIAVFGGFVLVGSAAGFRAVSIIFGPIRGDNVLLIRRRIKLVL